MCESVCVRVLVFAHVRERERERERARGNERKRGVCETETKGVRVCVSACEDGCPKKLM